MKILSRAKQILKILLTEEEAIPVKSLAEKIGVSKRTTQRELEYISSYLKGYEIKYFSKTGVGIWLEGTQEEKKRFYHNVILLHVIRFLPYSTSYSGHF